MNFKKGEVLFFNKPLGWTSFKVVGHARYHICRRIGVEKTESRTRWYAGSSCNGGDDSMYG